MEHWARSPPARSSPSFTLPVSSYIGDCEICVELQKIRAGVNGVQVSEDARPFQPPRWARGSGSGSPWNGAGKDTLVPDTGW